MTEQLRGRAPAKVNLVLAVIGRRPDGYHEIDTIIQELDLADDVILTFGQGDGISVSGPWAEGVPVDRSNLARKAVDALAAELDREPEPVHIHLEKRIPAAGGLGGGSSNAATVLRLLGPRWGAAESSLLAVAGEIGSDPPFFMRGQTARARGRGDFVLAVDPPLPPYGVILFVPLDSLESKTATLYQALGRLPFDDAGAVDRFLRHSRFQLQTSDLENSFERVAFDQFPGLGRLRDEVQAAIGTEVRLAGAGPTLFWIGPVEEAAAIVDRAGGLPCAVIATRTAE